MNARPAPSRVPGTWRTAFAHGGLAAAAALIAGQAFAFVDAASLHTHLGAAGTAKLGLLYVSLFSRGTLVGSTGLFQGELVVRLGTSLLLVTIVTGWLLYRGGARAAAEGGLFARGGAGARVAIVYAPVCTAAAAVTALSPLRTGDASVHAAVLSAFAWSLAMSAICGFAGGAMSRREDLGGRPVRRLVGAVAGGWSMLAYGVCAAFLALMVITAVKPSYSRTYLIGFREVRSSGGAAKALHNAAMLPNGSVWALAASMGACDGIYGTVNIDVLCYSHFPSGIGQAPAPVGGTESVPVPTTVPHIPLVLLIFVLVPPAAVLLGGAAGARIARPCSAGEAAAIGALAGVAFGPMMALAALVSGVAVGLSGGGMSAARGLFFGPRILTSTAVALAWGIPGGALGALAARRFRKTPN